MYNIKITKGRKVLKEYTNWSSHDIALAMSVWTSNYYYAGKVKITITKTDEVVASIEKDRQEHNAKYTDEVRAERVQAYNKKLIDANAACLRGEIDQKTRDSYIISETGYHRLDMENCRHISNEVPTS
jgi:hypothetical protein